MAIQWKANSRGGATATGTKWQAECYQVTLGWWWHFQNDLDDFEVGEVVPSAKDAVEAMMDAATRWMRMRLGQSAAVT